MVNGSIHKYGSESYRSYSSSECTALITVMITESVAIAALNILTIIVFLRNCSLHRRSMYLVINLAVADMFIGGFTEVVDLVKIVDWECGLWKSNVPYSGIWAYILSTMLYLFPVASLTNLAAISLERLHATFRPFKHRVIKNWVLGVVIMVTWVTAGLVSAVMVLSRNNIYIPYYYFLYVWCSFISVCMFIIFVSYTSIVVKVYCGAHPQHYGAASRGRKLTQTLFIVTLVSLMTWLPYAVYSYLSLNAHFSSRLVVRILALLFYANSLVNPILYAIRMSEFRGALVSLVQRQQRQVQVEIPLRVIPGN